MLKNSVNDIPSPSHSFFRVTIPGLELFPYKMFFMVDGAIPDSVANLFIVIFFSPHRKTSRFLTAI